MVRGPKKVGKKKKSKNSGAGSSAQGVRGGGDVEMGGAEGGAPAAPAQRPKVWQPGVDNVAVGEELQFDPTAYSCLHAFRLPWPCLSFDVVRDALGPARAQFPHTLYLLAGTQADLSQSNMVGVLKLSNLTRMKTPKSAEDGEDDDDDDSESDSDSEDGGDDSMTDGGAAAAAARSASHGAARKPSMQARTVAHHGGVNRIRSMPQQPHIGATWGDGGHVQVWEMSAHLQALSGDVASDSSAASGGGLIRQAPVQVFTGHKDEGFAIDWSPVSAGRLATGDCKAGIHVWEPAEGAKWNVDRTPFAGHQGSVEDIQWSPTEADVFASASVDHKIIIWDARSRQQPALTLKAHDCDVNVISWNRLASCMLASGADDGTFRIWDLRAFKEDAFVAHFKYHKSAITSIEWSPHESSTIACSSADDQTTIWDLSLERDEEEEAQYEAEQAAPQAQAPQDLPPQLLFVHQGQTSMKEVHWHPQIQGMLITTALDGFNVFRPSNL